jgi:hypothetical protein
MKKNVFISFTEKDRSLMLRLKKVIEKSSLITPIVIEEKKVGRLHYQIWYQKEYLNLIISFQF